MSTVKYRISTVRVIGNPAFYESSAEELRVLMALIELSGEAGSIDELASAAKTSAARCRSALALWEASGIICPDNGEPTITEEFDQRVLRGEIEEKPSVEVADSIRDEHLKSMIDECARLMNQPCLPNGDVKDLVGLVTQYGLTPEYVVTLAAHLVGRGCLTVKRLRDEAIKLSGKGYDSVEALEGYISELESTTGAEWEYRRLLGIYGRTLSAVEKRYFKKWSEEFGYSVAIVSEAYDLAVLNTRSGRGDLRYIDSVLTAWYEAGCRTVSDCREKVEQDRAKKTAEKAASGSRRASKSTPETPRYGNFDINEAFADAVARSFGEENNEGSEDR